MQKDLKYQIRLGKSDLQLFIIDETNSMWTREDLDKYGPVEDIPEDIPVNATKHTNSSKTITNNKRKEITPTKPVPKKSKEDNDATDSTDNKNEEEKADENSTTTTNIPDTDIATMDAELELAAKFTINNNI